ncbi:MAG TPA: GHMP kinase [Roseiflexaceae bacterium]|nr:GHMP kinase [Roseiflexaceae bacterium]
MNTAIPPDFADTAAPMAVDHRALLAALHARGLAVEDYPRLEGRGRARGSAAARAYPMQGVLKYHGMADWDWRTAFLPSVSLCNDAGATLTHVAFDPDLPADTVVIGGREAAGRDRERVVRSLDALRRVAGVASRARVVSRNTVRASTFGKGLGTSAAASAALALAAIGALFGAEAANTRFVSCMARLLAGSGCRSAAGGMALWLSYPGIPHEDSFAVRLDRRGELEDMRLITVPLDSRVGLKTEEAHRDAPHSSFFRAWMQSRRDEVLACLDAALAGDWRAIGRWAELDSIRLHGVTMSGSMENKIFGWEPENIHLFRMCNQLRAQGVPVYCSTDTGPTAVFITGREHEDAVVAAIHGLGLGLEAIRGRVAGPAHLVDEAAALAELGDA